LREYRAVFVATGLPRERKTGIPGENLEGVIGSLEFLEKARRREIRSLAGRQVVIIGGGNVSLDTAATAADLGAASVRLLYRRGPLEMKVWRAELESVQKRGVIIDYLTAPLELVGEKGKLVGIVCARTTLSDNFDSSGRRIPTIIDSSAYNIAADIAIISIGLYSDYCPAVSFREDMTSSVPGLFAGGDLARGEGTIVEAVRDGKLAARRIIEYLTEIGR
jgi:NADPH-dependent glutamate synthase beta subunit-like oxidoreductase